MPDNVVEVTGFGFRLRTAWAAPWGSLVADIREVKSRTRDLSVPFRQFQDRWFENEKVIFDAEGIPAWPALSPAYAALKAILYPGKPILQATGRLHDSLTSLTADTVYDVSPQKVTMGTAVEYSEKHQVGEGRLPQRVHVQMLESTFEDLNEAVFVYAVEPLNRGR
ncbi:MAG: hypothetical protein ACOYB2_10580 [Limnohabitans sp.]